MDKNFAARRRRDLFIAGALAVVAATAVGKCRIHQSDPNRPRGRMKTTSR